MKPVRVVFSWLFIALLPACTGAAPLPAKAIALNRDGAIAIGAGDYEKAEARVALALEYNPRFTEAWVNLGTIEMARGNFALAHRDFVRARDLNPDLPVAHHALGLLADREGHGDDAERLYRAALKVDPGFAPARVNLGRRLFARGAFEEAREQFLRTTEVAPGFVEGWAGLAEALLRLDREREAADVLRCARLRFGAHPSLDLLEARLLLRSGRFADAEERLGALAARADRPAGSAALSWLAVARLGRGNLAGAREAAERALAIDADDGVARYALQSVHERP